MCATGSYQRISGSKPELEGLEGSARDLGGGEGEAALVVEPDRGTTGRAGVGTGGGAEVVLCDRSRMDALNGERAFSIAGNVGRIATMDCILPIWVVRTSS